MQSDADPEGGKGMDAKAKPLIANRKLSLQLQLLLFNNRIHFYLLLNIYFLFHFQDCYAMLAVVNFIGVGPIFYSCGTAVVRYLYVRSSFEVNIQEVLKRDSFIFKSLFIGECVNLFNLGSFHFQPDDSDFGRSPLVLYQACLNPGKDHTFEVYKLMPWNQLIMIVSTIVNV